MSAYGGNRNARDDNEDKECQHQSDLNEIRNGETRQVPTSGAKAIQDAIMAETSAEKLKVRLKTRTAARWGGRHALQNATS
jgi:hypothetical protein